MSGLWLPLLGWVTASVIGAVLLVALIAIVTQPRDGEYSCGSVDLDEDGQDVPEDPDRARDWRIADDLGAL
ncbi:hypothetical protein NDR87_18890 [Nocardia sp. CDC159]|uniref:Uncharacterized protein n=1 Tax=Nocardia pulmonis TaxID=2951408 RepID=A0A9X2IXP4_9NOCA|nr:MULTISPECIES: hypothetical protein [Nocardia]MCM6776242.1 hypothetical protein [Nocardia pulmonis]MCM6788432.1 hypothetical protein [Nocardia sp. CDC159]